MIIFNAFVVCGSICLLGQLVYDHTKLTAGHITSTFVVLGAALDTFGLYDRLLEFAGAGASLPITSFGHSLIHGALAKAQEQGIIGILLGMFDLTAAGITSAILFAFLVAVIFKPKS
ncbi:MAG: stage V sporulation protein AE [Erysipelotrichaceae bacterium]|nr:stage V sporulation protein AE [Erysipelotrichaceae bacterium]